MHQQQQIRQRSPTQQPQWVQKWQRRGGKGSNKLCTYLPRLGQHGVGTSEEQAVVENDRS